VPGINFQYERKRAVRRLRSFAELLYAFKRIGQGYIGLANAQRPLSLSTGFSV